MRRRKPTIQAVDGNALAPEALPSCEDDFTGTLADRLAMWDAWHDAYVAWRKRRAAWEKKHGWTGGTEAREREEGDVRWPDRPFDPSEV